MSQYLLFALVGLGFGCVYAAIGMGVVITYRGTGIINFATGAMAMWAAYVYDELRRTGALIVPVIGLPHRVRIGPDVSFAVAFVLALLSAALIGLLVHFLVFRPLRAAPPLAKVVASIGILILVQALVVMQFGSAPRVVPPILPNEVVRFAGVTFPRDRIWLAIIVATFAAVIWAYFRFTKLGLATRAAAENEQAISLARYSPQFLAGTTWVLSSTVVGGLIILATPAVGLNPVLLPLAIVPALAAALIGRLQAIGATVVAGLALGSFQAIVTFQTSKPWWPSWAVTGLSDAVPFLIIVVALFFVGDVLPTRGSVESQPLPAVIRPRTDARLVIPCVLIVAGAIVLLDGSYRYGLTSSLIFALIMLSLVVLTGLVGQISLAQAAIAGAAGFALSKLTENMPIPFPVSTLLAALVATVFGVIIGIPALRVRGAELAVVTLAGAVALEQFVFRNRSFTNVAGNPIGDPTLFGLNLAAREGRTIARVEFGFLVLVVVTVCALLVANLARSATGRRFMAVRSNERAGASLGISVASTKLVAFAMASFLAGLGGAFIGYSRGQLSADSFTSMAGLAFLAFAYVGGITSISGAFIGGLLAPLGLLFVVVDRNVELGTSYSLVAGTGLVATAIFNPEGLAGASRRYWAVAKARLGRDVSTAPANGTSNEPSAPVEDVPSRERTRKNREVPADWDDVSVVLDVHGLVVEYGGLRAVDRFSMRLRQGQIVGLIGPNGAGKTTTIDALTGFVDSRGEVVFRGQSIQELKPHERARTGIARTWQALDLFTDLTVAENLQVAIERPTLRSVLADLVQPQRDGDQSRVTWALDLVGLAGQAGRKTSELSLGEQKLVSVARAVAGATEVLLLDEPAAGLDTDESRVLGGDLMEIAGRGISILLVDHDMGLVLDVCDYIYVLDFGRLIAEGTPASIRSSKTVMDAYLGKGVQV